jgi:hypothetical protein
MRSRRELLGPQGAFGILPAETTPFPAKSWRWSSRSTILEGTKFLSCMKDRWKEAYELIYSRTRRNAGDADEQHHPVAG